MGKTYLKRLTTLIISFGIILSLLTIVDINKIHAESGKEENTYATETLPDTAIFTKIDENGNIVEVEEDELNESGIVSEFKNGFKSAVPSKDVLAQKGVVNFRTKSSSGINTNFTEADTGRSGYINGYYAADAAYLGHNANRTKVKFMQAGVIGWVNADEVQVLDFSSSSVQTLSKYFVKDGRLYHGIVTNMKKSGYSSTLDCGPAPSYLKEGEEYYSYDGHYFYAYNKTNGYSTMLTDYRNDTRKNSVNPNNPYYNYYQFLPQRSQTVYSASEIDNYINKKTKSTSKLRGLGQAFVDNQNKYGINAMISLGIAINESSWGTSNIAQNKNNLFGHAAYDSDPSGSANKYSTPAFSVYYHTSTFMSKKYCNPTYKYYHGSHLGDKASGAAVKYASDPFWGEKAASHMWVMDKELGGKDAYKYTIGIKDTYNFNHINEDIKSQNNINSSTIYKSMNTYTDDIISNYPVINIGNESSNGYLKIQTDGVLNAARTSIVNQEEYNFKDNYAYISTKNVIITRKGNNSSSNNDNVIIYKKGDINKDKKIDSMDMYIMIQYITKNRYVEIADLNNDKKLDSMDMYHLIEIIK